MINELVEVENRARSEWKVKNDANQRKALQEYNEKQRKDEQKGHHRLMSVFNDENATLVSIFKKDCQGLDLAAQKMELHFKWINAPTFSWTSEWDSIWIIVGQTLEDVEAKHSQVMQEARERIIAKELQDEERKKIAQEKEKTAQEAA